RCSRFRHEPAYWEHIGHRWRGALALFDFQPQLSLSTISFARAYTLKPAEHGHDYGIERMKVIVKDDGSIHTAYPKSGGSVEKWSFAAGDWV
ncbi:hypothetical protein, partial [Haloarcula mannanilytica]|uniref:hypothetical protein n=1 Tax=Haloarcula mannanilytica TaxID=2509225 RepID=UPI001F3AFD65